jgi:hypothetical protein
LSRLNGAKSVSGLCHPSARSRCRCGARAQPALTVPTLVQARPTAARAAVEFYGAILPSCTAVLNVAVGSGQRASVACCLILCNLSEIASPRHASCSASLIVQLLANALHNGTICSFGVRTGASSTRMAAISQTRSVLSST